LEQGCRGHADSSKLDGAFYFYAEPNPFATYDITAAASDGTTVTQAVDGNGGASGYGFCASSGASIASIAVSSSVDSAVGEFGIASSSTDTPEPSAALIAAVGALAAVVGHLMKCRRRAA